MVSACTPSLDRLDFDRLQRLLADLGVQAGCWIPGAGEIQGLTAPTAVDGAQLLQLARDAQAGPDVLCRQSGTGAFAMAVRIDPACDASPVAVGCVAAGEAGLLARPFGAIVRYWYARGCEQAREVEVLSQSLAETYEELSVSYRLSEAMNLTASPRAYLEELADELRDLLAADAVVIALAAPVPSASTGDAEMIVAGKSPLPAERIISCVDMENLARRGYQLIAIDAKGAPAQNGDATAQVIYAPVMRSDRQLGVIAALRAGTGRKVSNIDLTRMSSISRGAAIVLENFRLYDNLRNLFLGTVRALTQSIDAKDPYTCGHSERVAGLARRLILQMAGTSQQADRIYLCGLLHDIGKIGVPELVLRKPGRLTDEEYAKIKRHPVVGAAILDGIQELDDVVPGVLHHHERMDGRGYPEGLSGEFIPLYSRVLAVADTFDAMTSARPYRKALSVQVAVDELKRHAGTQFDPAVVAAMLQLGPETIFRELSLIPSGQQAEASEKSAATAGGSR